jgi:hypothetical protein
MIAHGPFLHALHDRIALLIFLGTAIAFPGYFKLQETAQKTLMDKKLATSFKC